MSHEIDTTDGIASFASAHTDAWHMLGETIDHSFTAEEAMKEARLGGWNVRKLPMFISLPGEKKVQQVPGRNAVVRDNPVRKGQIDVLGDVGDSYQIIQNEQHAAFLNTLVDESGAHFETAGALYGGRQVFITMKLPGHIQVGGVDPVDTYLAAINSHDGSMSYTTMVTPVRVVCANTLNSAFGNNSHIFRIRHSSGAENILRSQARDALDLSFKFLDGFQEEAERLIQTTMTQSQFEAIIEKAFGPEEGASAAAVTRAKVKIDDIAELFSDAATQDGIRDTAWAGYNALTEWADHFSPTRGDDRDNARAAKALFDPSFKNTALQLMLQAV